LRIVIEGRTMKRPVVSAIALMLGVSVPALSSVAAAQEDLSEELVVTAQRREQSIQDVGIAITAFSGEQLQALGVSDSTDLIQVTPGLRNPKSNSGFTSSFSLRGLSQSDFGASQEAPVALYVDDVYYTSQGAAEFLLFDLERVEVLRGPQGTLFGRNATGGLVHYITQRPGSDFSGYAQATYARYDDLRAEGAFNVPLGPSLAARVSLAGRWHDPIVDNSIGPDLWDANEFGGRVQLEYEPNSDFAFLLNLRAATRDAAGQPWLWSAARPTGVAGTGQFTPGLTDFLGYTEPDDDPFTVSFDADSRNIADTNGFTGTISWNLGWATLTSITDFNHVEVEFEEDSDMQPGEFFHFVGTQDVDQVSQELRLNGETTSLRWVAGLYYLDANGDYLQRGLITDLGFGVGAQDTVYDVSTQSTSVFGQVEFDLSEQVTAIFGARYINEQRSQDYLSQFVDVPGGTPVAFGSSPDLLRFNGEIEDDLYSIRAELDWRPNDDLLFYASFNRGVKSGGFNAPLDPSGAAIFIDPLTFDPAPTADAAMRYAPETLNSYEIGFKSTLYDGRARFNVAAFYYDYQDFQALNFQGVATSYIQNRDATLQGVDAEVFATPIDNLNIVFGVSYLDQVVNDVAIGGNTLDREIPYAPEWNITGLVRYEWDAFGGRIAAQANANYVSDQYLGLSNADVLLEPSYTVVDARLSFTLPDERTTISLFVDNLTDEIYRTTAFDLSGTFGSVESQIDYDRTYGVTLNYRWGD
jgi:iron complex outermembrane receptor protein